MGFYNGLFIILLIVIPCCGVRTGRLQLMYTDFILISEFTLDLLS